MTEQDYLDLIAQWEAPFVMNTDSGFPVVIDRAEGCDVWSVDGQKYLDLTSFFGAAALGHGNKSVVTAIQSQAARLLHGMGDVHPPAIKADFLAALGQRVGKDYQFYMGLNGSDAVDTALKIVFAATGRPGVLAFEGGYHGLYSGALRATHRADFRQPFAEVIGPSAEFVPFPEDPRPLEMVEALLSTKRFGAVITETIQGRGGIRVMGQGVLAMLKEITHAHGALLIVDEVFTGVHRTGPFLSSLDQGVQPDVICMGKSLGGGMPLSVTAARREVLTGMGRAETEAIHTDTFISHPLATAAGLAVLRELERTDFQDKAKRIESIFYSNFNKLPEGIIQARGRGAMLGIETDPTRIDINALHDCIKSKGILVLPAGQDGRVIELTPPLVIDPMVFDDALRRIKGCLSEA